MITQVSASGPRTSYARGLSRWRGAGTPLVTEIMALADFSAIARKLCSGTLSAAEADPALDGICKDVGRYAGTAWVLGLHVAGGATLPRLKEASARSGLLSTGRARALLLYLQYLGYIERRTQSGPSAAHYIPTDSCIGAWRKLYAIALDAAAAFEPDAAGALTLLDRPDFLNAMFRAGAEVGLASLSEYDTKTPPWDVWLHRHAGMQVIHALMLSAQCSEFPPRGTMSVSLAELSRRLRVSRPQVRRVLSASVAKGLLSETGDGFQFTHGGRDAIAGLLAIRLWSTLAIAARAAAELDV